MWRKSHSRNHFGVTRLREPEPTHRSGLSQQMRDILGNCGLTCLRPLCLPKPATGWMPQFACFAGAKRGQARVPMRTVKRRERRVPFQERSRSTSFTAGYFSMQRTANHCKTGISSFRISSSADDGTIRGVGVPFLVFFEWIHALRS